MVDRREICLLELHDPVVRYLYGGSSKNVVYSSYMSLHLGIRLVDHQKRCLLKLLRYSYGGPLKHFVYLSYMTLYLGIRMVDH